MAFSPDGRILASGDWDDTIRFWDAVSGAHKRTLTGHTWQVNSVAFSPDGRTIASGGQDKEIHLGDTTPGSHKRTLKGHTGSVYSVGVQSGWPHHRIGE